MASFRVSKVDPNVEKGVQTYSIGNYMGCGNGYKQQPYKNFRGTVDEVDLMEEIVRAMRVKCSRKNPTNLIIDSSNNINKGILVFRLGRYFRNANLRNLLENMIEMYKNGIPFYKALPASHIISPTSLSGGSYNVHMDVYIDRYQVGLFENSREFESKLRQGSDRVYIKPSNGIYRPNNKLSELRKLAAEKKFRKLIKAL